MKNTAKSLPTSPLTAGHYLVFNVCQARNYTLYSHFPQFSHPSEELHYDVHFTDEESEAQRPPGLGKAELRLCLPLYVGA